MTALAVPRCCPRPLAHAGRCEHLCPRCAGTGRCPDCHGASCPACGWSGCCPDGCDLGTVRAWPPFELGPPSLPAQSPRRIQGVAR
jgi:hypothetical protein